VQLRTWTVEVTNNGGHAGLVAHCGREMYRLLGIIFREALNLASVSTRALSCYNKTLDCGSRVLDVIWSRTQKGQRTVARRLEFAVRHWI
jgi:hypothetical protein